jgi:hypothetical protein
MTITKPEEKQQIDDDAGTAKVDLCLKLGNLVIVYPEVQK